MSFRLSREELAGDASASAEDGAVTTFIGRVRNHNEGKQVTALEYEAFDALALSEGAKILEEALGRFAITSASCAHRLGELRIGDAAIRVDVASPQRQAAFGACRYIVDEAKRRLPIWKKERYADGSSSWVGVDSRPVEDEPLYERQMRLPQVGRKGQEKLRNAKVLVVGAGGLGCAALQCLAGAGVGTLGICEFDELDVSNLHRQPLYAYGQVGQGKAALAAERLRAYNPFIEVVEHPLAITSVSAPDLLSQYDIVLDCSDNFETKFLLNDFAISMRTPLVQASIYQFEGQLLVVTGGGPCLRCVWPEEPRAGCVGSCVEVGVLGFVPGIFGSFQAAEAIKLILNLESPLQSGAMLLLSLLDYSSHLVELHESPVCPACGSGDRERDAAEVDALDLQSAMVVDVRSPEEIDEEPCPVSSTALETGEIGVLARADVERQIVLVCRTGTRSLVACRELRAKGHLNVFSHKGGILALRRHLLGQQQLPRGDRENRREQQSHAGRG